jgi:glycerol-3-phosphate acyltransferase PlsY
MPSPRTKRRIVAAFAYLGALTVGYMWLMFHAPKAWPQQTLGFVSLIAVYVLWKAKDNIERWLHPELRQSDQNPPGSR